MRHSVLAVMAASTVAYAAWHFDISTGNDLHILKAGEEDCLAISLEADGEDAAADSLALE